MSVAATEPLVVPLLYDPSFKGSIVFYFHDSYFRFVDMHKTEKLKSVHMLINHVNPNAVISMIHLMNYLIFK